VPGDLPYDMHVLVLNFGSPTLEIALARDLSSSKVNLRNTLKYICLPDYLRRWWWFCMN
jgi:hypothetical protein